MRQTQGPKKRSVIVKNKFIGSLKRRISFTNLILFRTLKARFGLYTKLHLHIILTIIDRASKSQDHQIKSQYSVPKLIHRPGNGADVPGTDSGTGDGEISDCERCDNGT